MSAVNIRHSGLAPEPAFAFNLASSDLIPVCVKNDNNFTGVRKTFDGTTDETTSHLTKLQKPQQVIGYSHSTKRAKNARQVAGYGRAHVGAGHARDQETRGHGPLHTCCS